MMVIAMVLVALALAVTVFAGPAPSTSSRIPRGARDWLATLVLAAAAAAPLSLYVNGAFHPSSFSVAAFEAAGVALGLAVIARAAAGLIGAFVVVLSLTALVPLIDLLFGTPLGVRSPLAFQVAEVGTAESERGHVIAMVKPEFEAGRGTPRAFFPYPTAMLRPGMVPTPWSDVN